MSSSRPIRTRVLPGTAAALVGLAFIAYVALPVVLAHWLQWLLTEQGFTDVRLELGYPGLHALRVHRLALSGSVAGQAFTLSARELDIGYDLATLSRGRLRHLRVPDAMLRIRPDASAVVTPSQPIALPVPARWLAAFPLQELDVDKLQVEWHRPDGAMLTGSVRGQARRVDTLLQTHWSLASKTQPMLELALNLTAASELTATLTRPDAPDKPIISASIVIVANGLEPLVLRGSLAAQFKPLAALLSPWLTLAKTFTPIDGQLKASWRGTGPGALPATAGSANRSDALNGKLSIELSALRLGTILQDGNLHLDVTLTTANNALRWRIADNLRLSAYLNPAVLAFAGNADRAKFVRTAKPLVLRAPRALSGQLVLAPSALQFTIAPDSVWIVEHLETPDARVVKLTATLPTLTRFTYSPEPRQWKTAGLTIALESPAIQPGFAAIGAVENLKFLARLDAGPLAPLPPVTVNDAVMTVFGGQARAHEIRYDRARDTNAFVIELAHIDLARVVALEQQQQIEASGTLDGRLPFNLTRHGIRIENGVLQSSAPGGVIRYHPNDTVRSMAVANPNLKLVLDALSNYHYTKLDIGVNYAENGDLALQVAMAGRNPDWNANQPVNLNMNLSENIPVLLRSLRVAGEVTEKVQKQLRERSGPKP